MTRHTHQQQRQNPQPDLPLYLKIKMVELKKHFGHLPIQQRLQLEDKLRGVLWEISKLVEQ